MMLVCAAVIMRRGRVLIARRREDCPREPLKWEFPGGKVEPHETPQESLRREIKEELGLDIEVGEPYAVTSSNKGGVKVILISFLCKIRKGEPRALQCSGFAWAKKKELEGFDLAGADVPVAGKLRS